MAECVLSNLFAYSANRLLLLSFAYLATTIILSKISVMPDSVRAFLSLPSMLIIPAIWGFPFVTLFHLRRIFQNETVSVIFFSWLIGVFALTVVATVMQFLSIFSMFNLSLITIGFFLCTAYVIKRPVAAVALKRKLHLTDVAIGLSAMVFGAIPILIASINIPYPLFGLNYDLPRMISQPSLRAIESSYLPLSTRVPEVLLVSFPSFLYGIEPLGVLWMARFLLGSIFSLGIFLFIQNVTEKRSFALLASLLAPLLMAGSLDPTWTVFFDVPAQHFKSSTILFTIFPYALYVVDLTFVRIDTDIKLHWKKIVLPALALLLIAFTYFHFPEEIFGLPAYYNLLTIDPLVLPVFLVSGILISFLYSRKLDKYSLPLFFTFFWIVLSFSIIHREEAPFFVLTVALYAFLRYIVLRAKTNQLKSHMLRKICGKDGHLLRTIAIAAVVGSFVLAFLAHIFAFNLTIFSFPISNPAFDYLKLREFIWGNGLLAVVLSSIGVIGFSFKSRLHGDMTMCLVFAVLLLLYFFPVFWTYRLSAEISVFMAYLIVASLSNMIGWSHTCAQKTRNLTGLIRSIDRSAIGGLVLISIVFMSVFLPVWYRFSYRNDAMPEIGWQSFNSFEEIQVASFIRQNTPQDSAIISDYFTMYTLTPLSDRIWTIDKFMGPESPGFNEKLGRIKNDIFLAPNSSYAYENVMQIVKSLPFDEEDYIEKTHLNEENVNALIVISPRTNNWIRQQDLGFSLSLSGTVDPYILRIFNDDKYFEQIFSVGDYHVYQAKHNTTVEEYTQGQAIEFSNTSAIKIENSGNSSMILPFSIEFLLNPDAIQGGSTTDFGDLISKETNFQVKIANGSTSILAGYYGGNGWQNFAVSFPTSIAHSWHHLVVVFDGEGNQSRVSIYLDGQLMGSQILEGVPTNATSPIFIGSFGLQPGLEQYRGLLGVVRLYQTALNSTEVQYNFEHLDHPILEGLYIWYDMNVIVDHSLLNLSGMGGNGTIIGAQLMR